METIKAKRVENDLPRQNCQLFHVVKLQVKAARDIQQDNLGPTQTLTKSSTLSSGAAAASCFSTTVFLKKLAAISSATSLSALSDFEMRVRFSEHKRHTHSNATQNLKYEPHTFADELPEVCPLGSQGVPPSAENIVVKMRPVAKGGAAKSAHAVKRFDEELISKGGVHQISNAAR